MPYLKSCVESSAHVAAKRMATAKLAVSGTGREQGETQRTLCSGSSDVGDL